VRRREERCGERAQAADGSVMPSSSHSTVRRGDAGPVVPAYYGPTRVGAHADGVAVRGEHRDVAQGPLISN
jgi:hypothetical protein